MALKLYDSKDAVPEALRESAIETKDGKFAVVEETEDSTTLKASLEDERAKREAAEKLARKTADDLKKLETKQKAEKAGISDEQLQQIRADARKEVEAELAPKLADADRFAKENRELKLDNKVKALAADNGVRPERLSQWWRQFGDQFDLTNDGAPMVKDAPGKDVKKFIADSLKAEVPEFYVGSKAGGGGAAGIQDGGTSAAISTEDVLNNPGAALAAARAAGKTE